VGLPLALPARLKLYPVGLALEVVSPEHVGEVTPIDANRDQPIERVLEGVGRRVETERDHRALVLI